VSGAAKKTPLHVFHARRARMVEFAGFEMPLWYEGIIPEHMAVREAAGLFDVSHMGRLLVRGPGAEAFLNYALTNDVGALEPMSSHYSLLCNEKGGILDDIFVLRLAEDEFLLVPNAATRERDLAWLTEHAEGFDVRLEDVSDGTAMLAIQGPEALGILNALSSVDLASVPRYGLVETEVAGVPVLASRTGYTGEDGFELYIWGASVERPEKALRVWEALLEAGEPHGLKPCGLGARDTLRLEAGYPLYGADMDESTTPWEARLGFAVKLDKGPFIGRDALEAQLDRGIERIRTGLKLLERGVPRAGQSVLDEEGHDIGRITSGTFSPLLRRGIAMAYIPPELSEPGTSLLVALGRRRARAVVARFPFYDKTKYGWRRRRGPGG